MRFRRTWLESDHFGPVDDLSLLPRRLAHAAKQSLGADGAGLSMISETVRVPLGASDDASSKAERLQFSVGHGPCLDAVASHRPAWSGGEDMLRRWPDFAQQLFEQTPFRAVVSLPIGYGGEHLGALDVYLVDAAAVSGISLVDALSVSDEIFSALTVFGTGQTDPRSGEVAPAWLSGPAATERMTVWVAMGLLEGALHLSASDALAVLRARAYGESSTVDGIAALLVEGRLRPQDFGPAGTEGTAIA